MVTIKSPWFCFFYVLFSSLLFGASPSSAGSFHNIKLETLFPNNIACSESKGSDKSGEAVLQIINQHGPCSPLHHHETPNTLQLLQQDESRAESLRSRATRRKTNLRAKDVTLPANSGSYLDTGNFVVVVGLGTPKKDYTVIFDTGSDLTWLQCKPCNSSCYNQEAPYFDPSLSSTYTNITCTSPECFSLNAAIGISPRCSSSTCVYQMQYVDRSYSVGFLVSETLTLSPSTIFPKFLLGCGQKNGGLFGKADGLLGLGRGKISLVSQSYSKFAGVFSYCIPSTPSSTGYLTFGATDQRGTKFTPLLTDSQLPNFYLVNLIGISVGGQRLTIDPSVFSSSGTLMDSGTVITRLPPAAYSAVKSAFRQQISSYPSAKPFEILDTCYDISGNDTLNIPKIIFHFGGGADLDIDESGLMIPVNVSQVCLAIAGNNAADDMGIIGNKQQQRYGVVYDVAKSRIGFTPNACN